MPKPAHRLDGINISDVDVWIFDLDNTLYHARYRLFSQVVERIGTYVSKTLDLDLAAAKNLQSEYYKVYGSTLRGLMLRHDVDPTEFLEYVHDIDITWIPRSQILCKALERLEGRKVVFTSGSRDHAERVMQQLGVSHYMESVFDIASANYIPKPDPGIYRRFISELNIKPQNSIMFDDISRNLIPAHSLGMKTVWVRNDDLHSYEGGDGGHIDYITNDLVVWLKEYTG